MKSNHLKMKALKLQKIFIRVEKMFGLMDANSLKMKLKFLK
jgi:hypothetical protein